MRPRPVGALARARLFRALDEARRRPAVWVAGPPGAGKTTLVSTYVEERRLRTVWYRVQDEDADPATFFHYFGLAVEAAAHGRRRAPLPHLTAEYLPNLPVFSRRYFEQVYERLKAPCTLVFDNYPECPQDASLHEVLREALESMPARINIVVLSRAGPPPALAALRAQESIALLDRDELRLTARECSEVAKLRDVSLEEPALQELHRRTQGWTAGVVLALEQKGQASGAAVPPREATPQVVFDYFAGEIFERMRPEAQGFLLRAAYLPSMAAQRVVELAGSPDAESVLEELSRSNYFTHKLAPAVYQFHPLFREFLLRRAGETLPHDTLVELRRKAAALLEADGETAEAVALLIAAGALEDAMRVVLAHAEEMLQQGRDRVLEGWLRALPAELRESTPWALYWLGTCLLAFDPLDARAHLEHAFKLFERDRDAAGHFTAWASIIESFVREWGRLAPLDTWIAVLDELLARYPGYPSPEIEARVASGMFVALMYRQPHRADLPRWAKRVHSIVLNAPDAGTQMLLGNLLVHYYDSWVGNVAAAEVVIEAVRPRANAAGAGPLARIAWCAMQAGYYWHVGAHEEWRRAVNEGMEITRQTGARFMSSRLDFHAVTGGVLAGDLASAEQHLKSIAAGMTGGRLLYRAHYYYLASLVAFYRKDTLHAVASAREAVALADEVGVPASQSLYRVTLAHALFSHGHRREALRHLAESRRMSRRAHIVVNEFIGISSTVHFLLERGKVRLAVPLLRKMLAIARRGDHGRAHRPFWTSEYMTRLFSVALEHGIEVEYVRETIRRRKLTPPPEAVQLDDWPFPVRIFTLGRFDVLVKGRPLGFNGKAQKKPLEMLMALVALGGRDVSERQLAEALWPDAEGDAAHQACAVALHRLRKLLGCAEAISLQRNHFSLDPRYVWVDVWTFERWLAPRHEEPAAARARALDCAVALYQGPFLGKRMDPTWAIPLRERLRSKFMRHLAERGRALHAAGQFEAAVALFEKGLAADPLAEEFYRQLMLCYQAQDLRAEAIGVYQRCEKTLAATLGVAPGAKTVALYQALKK
jgi:LuxR family transcriptional regulator, maltose regulon positive regulatory protein